MTSELKIVHAITGEERTLEIVGKRKRSNGAVIVDLRWPLVGYIAFNLATGVCVAPPACRGWKLADIAVVA